MYYSGFESRPQAKTDCIFFTDTEQNRLIAITIIESYGLECKVENKNVNKLKTLEK